jgi:hypothetical protein
MADLALPKPDSSTSLGGCISSICRNERLDLSVFASLLSCAGQLCQKQATRPSKSGRAGTISWLAGAALLSRQLLLA